MSQTLPSNTGSLSLLQQPVINELSKVDQLLQNELRPEVPWMNELLQSSTLSQGKRMRPTLLLLAGRHFGELNDAHIATAAAIEMIHVASLVHDDLIDGAESRRHQPTVNQQHGAPISILLGDYLFTHAFSVASRAKNSEAISIIAQASNRVCEGEMRQNFAQGNLDLSLKDYFSIISDKTGELCAATCHLGAFLSGANEHECAGFEKYGRDLGVAFQVIDDVLDLVGSTDEVGKTLGTDVSNLKLTLPMIHCRDNLTDQERDEFFSLLVNQSDVAATLKWLEKTGSIDFARKVAQTRIGEAIQFAKALSASSPSPAGEALAAIGEFVLQRTY